MPNNELLPIKVVFSSKEDYHPANPGGGTKIFGTVTDELRSSLTRQIRAVRREFAQTFDSFPYLPAVAKVILKSEATAKTHRPLELLNEDTCPIIGANRLGELYVSVSQSSLDILEDQIAEGNTKKLRANISTLERIEPYTSKDALRLNSLEELQSRLEQNPHIPLRFRLFRHGSPIANRNVRDAFQELLRQTGVTTTERMRYSDGLQIYSLKNVPAIAMPKLAKFVGTQSLSYFPDYKIVRTASRVLGNISPTTFPKPKTKTHYALVGMIDSGTDPENPLLQAWVEDRFDVVPREEQNNEHGSFVAGLLIHSRTLNHNDPRFPAESSRIIDVAAIDKNGEISEYDLLHVLDKAIAKYPHVRVWNLSLGLASPCAEDEFSYLASALDERAKHHGILFVIAAGNYAGTPFRSWPPQSDIEDRISPPADAVHAISVGAIAHTDNTSTCVRREEPSPFSRRGPGPAYILKPELSHYGGNCDLDGNYLQTGVVSLDDQKHLAENIGTSFACPLVSTVAANVFHQLDTPVSSGSSSLVKALLIHSAFLQQIPNDAKHLNYFGIGRPLDSAEIISCQLSSATMIFQIPLFERFDFGKGHFPMPSCLIDDEGLRGEILMTLAYQPAIDRNHGIEYCRSNVTASLGTIRVDTKTGKPDYDREVHPVPKKITKGLEKDLLQHGGKWSPIKLYYRKFQNGPVGKEWRLSLKVLTRSECHLDGPLEVSLIITIRDPEMKAPVYNELVREMNRLNWQVQNLEVRNRQRIQS